MVPPTYYADPTTNVRLCTLTCTPPLFGNNSTRTCETTCLDFNSHAESQSSNRVCIDRCWPAPIFRYANNFTKICGTDLNCPTGFFAENITQRCVEFCPSPSWGFRDATRRVCLDKCPDGFAGDNSSGKRLCVTSCPTRPDRYADLVLDICVGLCNDTFFGYPANTLRTC